MSRLHSLLAVLGLGLSIASPAASGGQDAAVLASPPSGQAATAFPAERDLTAADFPRVIRLAQGVYAYEDLRVPGFTTVSLFVVGARGVLIADGQESPSATRRLLAAIARVTSRPVRWHVIGSDHADHTGGNSALPPGITYIVHPTSRQQLARDAANARPDDPPVVIPPRAMRGSSETVDIGGRTVRVLHLGRAHTGGDLLVHVPDAGVLFMSEVFFNRVFPAMRSARPSEWLAAIDASLQLNARIYVPGHGFVEDEERSREELVEFRGALLHVIAEATRLHALGLSPEEALGRADWGPYAGWMLADTQRLVAIRQVYAEIEGSLDG